MHSSKTKNEIASNGKTKNNTKNPEVKMDKGGKVAEPIIGSEIPKANGGSSAKTVKVEVMENETVDKSQQELMAALAECETVIKKGFEAVWEMTRALKKIRDERLYKARGYTDFDKYMHDTVKMGKSWLTRQIKAMECVEQMEAVPDHKIKKFPMLESQCRLLLDIGAAEDRVQVWKKATSIAKKDGLKEITAPVIRKAIGACKIEVSKKTRPKKEKDYYSETDAGIDDLMTALENCDGRKIRTLHPKMEKLRDFLTEMLSPREIKSAKNKKEKVA